MDWHVVHALNSALGHHDGIEDALVIYERLSELVFLLILAGLVCFASDGLRRAAVAAGFSAAAALLLAQIIVRIVDRPRPFVMHPAEVHRFLQHAPDPGFPSDHATAACAVSVALLLRSRAWGIATLLLAVVIMAGRVALGVHYPSDVLVGGLLGGAVALLLARGWPARVSDRLADRLGLIVHHLGVRRP
jgi:undecaprenyl-diphosphatase